MRAAPEIKGWCPSASRPMASGDGLLLRADTCGARLTLKQAQEIALIAQDCGNGSIDLTQRAQIQLRGIQPETLVTAQNRLAAAGLAPTDGEKSPPVSIVVSPFATGVYDAEVLMALLTAAVRAEPSLRTLPDKFLFLIDHGGAPGLAKVDADIRLEAFGDRIALVLDGAREQAALVETAAACAAAVALARAFAALRTGRLFERRRMRALVTEVGAAAVFAAADLRAGPYASCCVAARVRDWLGATENCGAAFAGFAAPFGRIQAAEFSRLLAALEKLDARELRLTPWRGLLAPAPSRRGADEMAETAQRFGYVTNAKDPRLAVVACPGAPECLQALGSTREAALALAPFARALSPGGGVGLHISGCAKGCANPSTAPLTLVCNGSGFDLIRDGSAGDPPAVTGLDIADIPHFLETQETSCLAR